MNRPGCDGPGNRDRQAENQHEATAIDDETAATITAIASLRERLGRRSALEHPAVRQALRALEEQITARFAGQPRPNPRRRHPRGRSGGQQISDACGFDLKPDPQTATTAAEFTMMLRTYRAWSGQPSWRQMAAQAGQTVVHSTIYAALHSDALPALDVVKALVTGCGGGEDDLRAFVTAWRRVEIAKTSETTAGTSSPAASAPTLRLVPGD